MSLHASGSHEPSRAGYEPISSRVQRAADPSTSETDRAELAADPSPQVRAAIAARADTSEEFLEWFTFDTEVEVMAAALANPNCPAAALERFRFDKVPFRPPIARALAGNPRTPLSTLEKLGWSPRFDVIRILGANPSTPEKTLRRLATSTLWPIRAAVISNSSCPAEILRRALLDVPAVRFEAAANPSIDMATLVELTTDDWPIAARAASNPTLPTERIAELAADPAIPSWVARHAAMNPACPSAVADATLTWLALGGADDDPSFDPVHCTGSPCNAGYSVYGWYQEEANRYLPLGGTCSPLWRARSIWTVGKSIEPGDLAQLVADPHPEVRRRASGFRPMSYQLALQMVEDADPVVAAAGVNAVEAAKAKPEPSLLASYIRETARSPIKTFKGGTSKNSMLYLVPVLVVTLVGIFMKPENPNPPTITPGSSLTLEELDEAIDNLPTVPVAITPSNSPYRAIITIEEFSWPPPSTPSQPTPPAPLEPPTQISPEELRLKDCFDLPDLEESRVLRVDCAQPHQAEVFSISSVNTIGTSTLESTCATRSGGLRTKPHPNVNVGKIIAGGQIFCVIATDDPATPLPFQILAPLDS